MSDDLAIRVEHLSKRYRLGARQPYRRVGESIARAVKRPFRGGTKAPARDLLWALKDVSMDVRQGEIVGLIGANGAGKTTLLRVLSKITRPTEGSAAIYGRVGSLLEVGTGFHPELTGRENVFLNGAILGMPRKEIARKYDEIVEFSQIEEFMETPVKHYSSGMRVRLAFSVAAHLEPEILFIDEVLAVGDAAFQQKSLGKMEEVAGAGRTVLFVSHNMGMITGLCTRAVLFEEGVMKMDDEPQAVVEAYLSKGYSSDGRWVHPADADCGQDLRINSVEILGPDGPRPSVPFEDEVAVRISYDVHTPVRNVEIVIRLTDVTGTAILVSSNVDNEGAQTDWEPGSYSYVCTIPGGLLRPGRYWIGAQAKTRHVRKLDRHENCLGLEILPIRYAVKKRRAGVITPILPWTLERASDKAGI